MWWFPLLCILIVIVVACIFQPLATTLRRRWTDHHGQLGPEGQQCELRETPAFPTERERRTECGVEVIECITGLRFSPSNYCLVAVNRNEYKTDE